MNEIFSAVGVVLRCPFWALGVVLYTPFALIGVFWTVVVLTLLEVLFLPFAFVWSVFDGTVSREEFFGGDNFAIRRRLWRLGVFNPYSDMTEWLLFGSAGESSDSRHRFRRQWRFRFDKDSPETGPRY